MSEIKRRNPFVVILLSFITLGIYYLYWAWQTKREINSLGAQIPTTILFLIPIVNWYWMWKYCEGYAKYVKKDENAGLMTFLAFFVLFPIAEYLVQTELNKLA